MKSVSAIGSSCCSFLIVVVAIAFTTTNDNNNNVLPFVTALVVPQQQQQHHYNSLLSYSPTSSSSSLSTRSSGSTSTSGILRRATLSSNVDEQTIGDSDDGKHQIKQQQIHSISKNNVELNVLACKCGDFDKQVIDLATQCQNQWEQMTEDGMSDLVSFNIVLKAWGKCCHVLAENKRLRLDHQYYSKTKAKSSDSGTSGIIITAKDAAERATTLLLYREKQQQQEEEENNDDNSAFAPLLDTTSYNTVMDAWAKSRCDQAPNTAERILSRMIENPSVQPDILSYRAVMDAWSHYAMPSSLSQSSSTSRRGGKQQQQSSSDIGKVAETCSSTGFQRVKQIYQHVVKLYDEKNDERLKPSIKMVNCVINAYAKRAHQLAGIERDFTAGMEIAAEAYELLENAQRHYEETNDVEFRPTIQTYTSCMDAYAQCCNVRGTQKAEEIFRKLKHLSSVRADVSERRPDLAPNTKTYTTLIMAWSKTKADQAPIRAEEILKEMEESCFNSKDNDNNGNGDLTVKPNFRTYTSVIQTWARSRDPKKAIHALDLLKRMKEHAKNGYTEMTPTLVTYNAAIDACAKFVSGFVKHDADKNNKKLNNKEKTEMINRDIMLQTQALKIAFAVFKSIEHDKQNLPSGPNHVSYATLMKAVSMLLPVGAERNKIATALFEKAKKAGQVEYSLLKHLRTSIDSTMFVDLLSELKDDQGYVNYNRIPTSWSKHVS